MASRKAGNHLSKHGGACGKLAQIISGCGLYVFISVAVAACYLGEDREAARKSVSKVS